MARPRYRNSSWRAACRSAGPPGSCPSARTSPGRSSPWDSPTGPPWPSAASSPAALKDAPVRRGPHLRLPVNAVSPDLRRVVRQRRRLYQELGLPHHYQPGHPPGAARRFCTCMNTWCLQRAHGGVEQGKSHRSGPGTSPSRRDRHPGELRRGVGRWRIREDNLYAECGSGETQAVEWVGTSMGTMKKWEDGKVEVFEYKISPDLHTTKSPCRSWPSSVEVPLPPGLPARLRAYPRTANSPPGELRPGYYAHQRRISPGAGIGEATVEKGFTLKHIGTILHAKFHQDFGAIFDKVPD